MSLFPKLKYAALLASLAVAASCEDDGGIVASDIEVPEGYALSAGTSTIFTQSTFAYDSDADWLSGEYTTRFNRGDRLYKNARVGSNDYGGGLGPVYAGYSCESCHRNSGRTVAANNWKAWNEGAKDAEGYTMASGSTGFSSMLVYITRTNGSFFSDYGRVLHDQAIEGVKPEGKLKVKWADEETVTFPDG